MVLGKLETGPSSDTLLPSAGKLSQWVYNSSMTVRLAVLSEMNSAQPWQQHVAALPPSSFHSKADIVYLSNKHPFYILPTGWNSSTLATSCEELTPWKRLWCWEGLGAGGEEDDRGWDGWMASLTQWMWVWMNSGRWWWTGRPVVLWFVGSWRVGHDWATGLNWTELISSLPVLLAKYLSVLCISELFFSFAYLCF